METETLIPDVLEAVERLAKPSRTKIIQDGPLGSGLAGQQIVHVTQPPLLVQLEAAVKGTIGIGGSGSLPNERNMLDSDALHRFVHITTTIRDWARSFHADVYPLDMSRTLQAWFVKWAASPRAGLTARFYLKKLTGWAAQIETKLDPPRVREIPDPCPVCDALDWFNPTDKLRYLHPLRVEYRPSGADMIQEAKALCQSCGAVWGIRQLAYEIELAEIRRAEPSTMVDK